jgi:hypothetical protein
MPHALLLLILGFAPALRLAPCLPQVVLPRPADLQAAQRDDVELWRVAQRLGPARLLRIAEAGPPGTRVAALRGLGLLGQGDAELAGRALLPLAELLLRTSDPAVLMAGADAAYALAGGLLRGLTAYDSLASDELPRAAGLLLKLAGDEALGGEARVRLLQAALRLPPALWRKGPLKGLAESPERPLRQAALAALGRLLLEPGPAPPDGLLALLGSEDPELSAAALTMLCEVLPDVPGGTALPPDLAERVRTLLARKPQKGPQRKPLTACLRRLTQPGAAR